MNGELRDAVEHAQEVGALFKDEAARLREALRYIAEHCGDDSRPEDNAVQIARDALEASDEQ